MLLDSDVAVAVIAAICIAAMAIAGRSGGSQIILATDLIIASCLLTIVFGRLVSPDVQSVSFASLHAGMATAFYILSRRRWFPVLLFFVFGTTTLVFFAIATLRLGDAYAVTISFNAYAIALTYVVACAIYRIRRRREQTKTRPASWRVPD